MASLLCWIPWLSPLGDVLEKPLGGGTYEFKVELASWTCDASWALWVVILENEYVMDFGWRFIWMGLGWRLVGMYSICLSFASVVGLRMVLFQYDLMGSLLTKASCQGGDCWDFVTRIESKIGFRWRKNSRIMNIVLSREKCHNATGFVKSKLAGHEWTKQSFWFWKTRITGAASFVTSREFCVVFRFLVFSTFLAGYSWVLAVALCSLA